GVAHPAVCSPGDILIETGAWMDDQADVLEVSRLVKRFAGNANEGGDVRAVDEITFSVPRGEMFTLLGPSGCGKTTTLRCIAGLERPDAGSITVAGSVMYSSDSGVFIPTE